MIEQFCELINGYSNYITKMGITQVGLYENKKENGEIDSLVVTHETLRYIGQITVCNNGRIDIEILSTETNELDFYIYLMTKKSIDMKQIFKYYIDYIK